MTRLGNTLKISSNPMSLVMLCYLKSLDSSIDSLQSVRVVREYPDILGEVKGGLPLSERLISAFIWLIMLSQLRGRLGTWSREMRVKKASQGVA